MINMYSMGMMPGMNNMYGGYGMYGQMGNVHQNFTNKYGVCREDFMVNSCTQPYPYLLPKETPQSVFQKNSFLNFLKKCFS